MGGRIGGLVDKWMGGWVGRWVVGWLGGVLQCKRDGDLFMSEALLLKTINSGTLV